jgi:formylglycine-generating enzyme required for sulfatase activity
MRSLLQRATRRALVTAFVLGLVLVGSVGVWLAAPEVLSAAPSSGPLSPERERALHPKDRFAECSDCPELVVLPAGSFMMGLPNQGPGSHAIPQHRVTIGKPFAVGRFAVTFDEWDACAADGGCKINVDMDWGRGQRPVILVSWDDAKTYLEWLSRKTGKPYRLLSEAEFEYGRALVPGRPIPGATTSATGMRTARVAAART